MYDLQESPQGFTVALPADFQGADMVCAAVEKFMNDRAMSDGLIYEVQLGLREALSNAILHGSRANAANSISFRFSYDKDRIRIRIRDEGPGFDWRNALDKPVTPLQENGMGLKIIGFCFDEFRFNEAGNEVELVKKVPEQSI